MLQTKTDSLEHFQGAVSNVVSSKRFSGCDRLSFIPKLKDRPILILCPKLLPLAPLNLYNNRLLLDIKKHPALFNSERRVPKSS